MLGQIALDSFDGNFVSLKIRKRYPKEKDSTKTACIFNQRR